MFVKAAKQTPKLQANFFDNGVEDKNDLKIKAQNGTHSDQSTNLQQESTPKPAETNEVATTKGKYLLIASCSFENYAIMKPRLHQIHLLKMHYIFILKHLAHQIATVISDVFC